MENNCIRELESKFTHEISMANGCPQNAVRSVLTKLIQDKTLLSKLIELNNKCDGEQKMA